MPSMMVSGEQAAPRETASFTTLMAESIMANGRITSVLVMVFIKIKMEDANTKANGQIICSTAKGTKSGKALENIEGVT